MLFRMPFIWICHFWLLLSFQIPWVFGQLLPRADYNADYNNINKLLDGLDDQCAENTENTENAPYNDINNLLEGLDDQELEALQANVCTSRCDENEWWTTEATEWSPQQRQHYYDDVCNGNPISEPSNSLIPQTGSGEESPPEWFTELRARLEQGCPPSQEPSVEPSVSGEESVSREEASRQVARTVCEPEKLQCELLPFFEKDAEEKTRWRSNFPTKNIPKDSPVLFFFWSTEGPVYCTVQNNFFHAMKGGGEPKKILFRQLRDNLESTIGVGQGTLVLSLTIYGILEKDLSNVKLEFFDEFASIVNPKQRTVGLITSRARIPTRKIQLRCRYGSNLVDEDRHGASCGIHTEFERIGWHQHRLVEIAGRDDDNCEGIIRSAPITIEPPAGTRPRNFDGRQRMFTIGEMPSHIKSYTGFPVASDEETPFEVANSWLPPVNVDNSGGR